jgi:hypothetical protein
MEWLSDDVDGEFDCRYCKENELDVARNCDGNTPQPVGIKVYGDVFYRCPSKLADEEWSRVVNIVSNCEGGGMAISRILPSQLFNETGFFINVRRIILAEQRRVEKWREKHRKEKDG